MFLEHQVTCGEASSWTGKHSLRRFGGVRALHATGVDGGGHEIPGPGAQARDCVGTRRRRPTLVGETIRSAVQLLMIEGQQDLRGVVARGLAPEHPITRDLSDDTGFIFAGLWRNEPNDPAIVAAYSAPAGPAAAIRRLVTRAAIDALRAVRSSTVDGGLGPVLNSIAAGRPRGSTRPIDAHPALAIGRGQTSTSRRTPGADPSSTIDVGLVAISLAVTTGSHRLWRPANPGDTDAAFAVVISGAIEPVGAGRTIEPAAVDVGLGGVGHAIGAMGGGAIPSRAHGDTRAFDALERIVGAASAVHRATALVIVLTTLDPEQGTGRRHTELDVPATGIAVAGRVDAQPRRWLADLVRAAGNIGALQYAPTLGATPGCVVAVIVDTALGLAATVRAGSARILARLPGEACVGMTMRHVGRAAGYAARAHTGIAPRTFAALWSVGVEAPHTTRRHEGERDDP